MEVAEPAADIGVGNLPDQAEYRRVHGVGREQAGCGVEQTGPRHDGASLRAAGGECCAKRHQRRALFVARVNGAQLIRGPKQRVEQVVVLHARQRINGVDAVGNEGADNRVRGGHLLRGLFLRGLFRRFFSRGHGHPM
jgi:hypothetical protein